MKAGKTLAVLTLLAICFWTSPVFATVVFQEDFQGAGKGAVHGQDRTLALGEGEKGWSSPQGGNREREVDYLEFPVEEVFTNPDSGTIEFYIRRGEKWNVESPFALMDADGRRVFSFRIYWSGILLRPDYPEISFYHSSSQANLLYTRINGGGDGRLPEDKRWISFGKPVKQGDWVHVAMTWGGSGENALYVDGRKLEAVAREPNSFPSLIKRSARLIIGAEGWEKNPDGAYGLTTSVIKGFRVHDTVLSPDQFGIDVKIRSVSHDAFARAGYSGKLVFGESFTVTMNAEPGCEASVDVVRPESREGNRTIPRKAILVGVPLKEDSGQTGVYTGSYTVQYGDAVSGGLVIGHLVHPSGVKAVPVAAQRPIDIDGRVHMQVATSSELIPADKASRSGLTVVAKDANGRAVRDHQLKVTASTTDEYTGTVGGGTFEEAVGGALEVDWKGVTDSFGEVTAQYVAGFAAKTILISAKDMVSGDLGVGWVRSYIDGTVDIVVKRPESAALAFAGTLEITASRTWLTADGKSRSRITAVVKDEAGNPMSGHNIRFSMAGDNGSLKVVQSRTDSRGRAYADYVAGIVMGQVTIEVMDTTSGLSGSIVIELRPDAPAEIKLLADAAEVYIGGDGTTVTATVKDVNGNPNNNVDVVYDIPAGEGGLSAGTVATDNKGKASVVFTPGQTPGTVTVRGTVTSRVPTAGELSAAEGAVFLYGLPVDPGPLTVGEWKVKADDEVVDGQELVTLTDRTGKSYQIKAPRDGKVSVFAAEEGDEVNYGDTLGYVLLLEK